MPEVVISPEPGEVAAALGSPGEYVHYAAAKAALETFDRNSPVSRQRGHPRQCGRASIGRSTPPAAIRMVRRGWPREFPWGRAAWPERSPTRSSGSSPAASYTTGAVFTVSGEL